MCGIVGIVGKSNVNQALYDALTVLQHRGQDAAGIVTSHDGRLFLRKDNGLVRDVFHQRHMQRLVGHMGIGHVRYPTAGSSTSAEAQPFYVNSPYGITLAHNGNLTNVEQLAKEIYESDLRHVNTNSDSEVLLNVFAHELAQRGKLQPTEEDVFAAVTDVHNRCRGGYAVVAMITGYGIVGFRDPNAIRPIVFGQRHTDEGVEYMIASESVSLDVLGFTMIRDLAQGEEVYITEDGKLHTRQCAVAPKLTPCIFEHVYLARPDSIIDGVSVYKARLRMGEKLADKILRERPQHDIDVVIPIPDTDRKSTRLNSSHTVIYTLSLHDALPICFGVQGAPAHGREAGRQDPARAPSARYRRGDPDPGHRSEEHTSELQSHSDLHSFPTRRSSDLFRCTRRACAWARSWPTRSCASALSTISTW